MNALETMLSAVADTFDAKALIALVEMRKRGQFSPIEIMEF